MNKFGNVAVILFFTFLMLLPLWMVSVPDCQADSRVIPVPFVAADPTIPHPAYNGHPVTVKAIFRSDEISVENVYFRIDVDGDGTWDPLSGRTPDVTGGWYQGNRYVLGGRYHLPFVDPSETTRKYFFARIEVAPAVSSGGTPVQSFLETYPILLYADVPVGRVVSAEDSYAYTARPLNESSPLCGLGDLCDGSGFPCACNEECRGDDPFALLIKRQVAVDDALWYLHQQMSHYGTGSAISGYPEITSSYNVPKNRIVSAAAYLRSLSLNRRYAAYPPLSYVHGGFADVQSLPAGWQDQNEFRWESDPYAEDAARLVNYLASLGYMRISVNSQCEFNDGRQPIPGTDNGSGYWVETGYEFGQIISALSSTALADTCLQTGVASGHTLKYLVQELVDAAVSAQNKTPYCQTVFDGSWLGGYVPGNNMDPYATHFMVEGLWLADQMTGSPGVIVNNNCKFRIANFLINNQDVSGSGKYSPARASGNDPDFTATLVLGHAWLGTPELSPGGIPSFQPYSAVTNDQLLLGLERSLGYIGETWYDKFQSSWNSMFSPCNFEFPLARFDGMGRGSVFTHFALGSAIIGLDAGLNELSGGPGVIPWKNDFSYYAVNSQLSDGSTRMGWGTSGSRIHYVTYRYDHPVYWTALSQAMLLSSMESSLNLSGPVAVASADRIEISAGCSGPDRGNITFYHGDSFHMNPGSEIVEYRWLFDVVDIKASAFDSVDWSAIPDSDFNPDRKAFHTSIPTLPVVQRYNHPGTYFAALQVVDRQAPVKTDIITLTITVTAPDPSVFFPDRDCDCDVDGEDLLDTVYSFGAGIHESFALEFARGTCWE